MSVARVYATVLYSAIEADASALDRAQQALVGLAELLAARADLRAALAGPLTTATEKRELVSAIAARLDGGAVVQKFLELVVRKGRVAVVADIAEAFHAVRVEARGGVVGAVESAEPLLEADLAELSRAFAQKLGRPVALVPKTRPELLAGLRVSVQGTTYDGSLQAKLQRLRQTFLDSSNLNH